MIACMSMEWYERLKARREQLGWSPSKLSKLSKVSRPQILSIEEGGVRFPRRETVMALASALGLDYGSLYAGENTIHELPVEYEPVDPELAEIQVNLKAIKRLDRKRLEELARFILAVKEQTEREAHS
jgi:transcriptional regulator with XRE-family HTH domain